MTLTLLIRFDFELPVPMDSAPYERNKFGEVRHYVVVDVHGPSICMSEFKEISLCANPIE